VIARLVPGHIYYAWIVAGITFLTLLCAAGFRARAIRTWTGDYLPAFVAAGTLCLMAAILVVNIPAVGRRPRVSAAPRTAPT
jgi:hypothetical protein